MPSTEQKNDEKIALKHANFMTFIVLARMLPGVSCTIMMHAKFYAPFR